MTCVIGYKSINYISIFKRFIGRLIWDKKNKKIRKIYSKYFPIALFGR